MRRVLVMTVLMAMMGMGQGQAAPGDAVPFTQGDRDTLVRLEAKTEGLDQRFQDQVKHLDQRFLDQEKAMDRRLVDFQKVLEQRFAAQDQRFIAMEQRSIDFQKALDQRFADMDKRMESLERFFTILAGIFTPLIVVLIGFVFWDRITLLNEVRRQADAGARKITEEAIREPVARVNQTQETLTAILDALRQWGEKSPEFREILKKAHLL